MMKKVLQHSPKRITAMTILILVLIWLGLHLFLRSEPIRDPFLISHRGGAALAPENTVAAISATIEHGAQFIEVDVQRTADDVLIVMHDETVDRTTNGKGKIQQMNWDEIKVLDAGSHFSPAFANEPVPKLESVLELLNQKPATLVLEAKSPALYPGMEAQITEMLQKSAPGNDVVVISFDQNWLKEFHRIAPKVPLGRLNLWALRSQQPPGIRFVAVHWLSVLIDPTQIGRMHRQGYTVVVWTVNNAWLMELLWWLGVDGITTDYPNRGAEVLDL